MKTIVNKISLFAATLLLCSTAALAGGRDGGGANVRPASKTDILNAINQIWNNDKKYSKENGGPENLNDLFYYLLSNRPEESNLNMIYSRWFDPKYNPRGTINAHNISKALFMTNIIKKDEGEGDCLHNGVPSIASIYVSEDINQFLPYHTGELYSLGKKAKIITLCYSLPLMEKHFQENNILKPLIALTAHEFAHAFGFNEKDSQQMEDYILKNYYMLEDIKGLYRFMNYFYRIFGLNYTDFSTDLKDNKPTPILCRKLGKLYAYSLVLSEDGTDNMPRDHYLTKKISKLTFLGIYRKLHSASAFCGEKEIFGANLIEPLPPISEGNKLELFSLINSINDDIAKIEKLINPYYSPLGLGPLSIQVVHF